jgi:hypothetical protein
MCNAVAELQRVKEQLAVAQSQVENNDTTLEQVKLSLKSQLERVKAERDELLAAAIEVLDSADPDKEQPPSWSSLGALNEIVAKAEGRAQ